MKTICHWLDGRSIPWPMQHNLSLSLSRSLSLSLFPLPSYPLPGYLPLSFPKDSIMNKKTQWYRIEMVVSVAAAVFIYKYIKIYCIYMLKQGKEGENIHYFSYNLISLEQKAFLDNL